MQYDDLSRLSVFFATYADRLDYMKDGEKDVSDLETVLDELPDNGCEVVGINSPATCRCRLRRRVTVRL